LYEINHPNLLKFYETIFTEDSVYIVTELLECVNIANYMKTHGLKRIEESSLRGIVRQIFLAFEYLHKKNIAHRDVKMENILIDEKMNIKIIDFGFSLKLEKG